MKSFYIPQFYRSPVISKIKKYRRETDPRKKDHSPTKLDFGPVQFFIARHFGFCYGVENAIEISYKAIEENTGKRIFLLSEMIHNPYVNNYLIRRGVKFIMDTNGNQLIAWEELKSDDIVIIPAFGTTKEIQKILSGTGISTLKYDTTCPFVEKVWNKANILSNDNFTIIVHGKHKHEETRATFSHSQEIAPTVIIRNIEEAKILGDIISGKIPHSRFFDLFADKHSKNFDPLKHLNKIGIVNQTTMLATETQEIADLIREIMMKKFGEENIDEHFADTRDTLCYATHDNQKATNELLKVDADIAVVIGGYNSSNTSHIVELCEEKLPTYFISSEEKIISPDVIKHFNLNNHREILTENYIPEKRPVKIILTSGASCPDLIIDNVLQKLISYFKDAKSIEEVIKKFE